MIRTSEDRASQRSPLCDATPKGSHRERTRAQKILSAACSSLVTFASPGLPKFRGPHPNCHSDQLSPATASQTPSSGALLGGAPEEHLDAPDVEAEERRHHEEQLHVHAHPRDADLRDAIDATTTAGFIMRHRILARILVRDLLCDLCGSGVSRAGSAGRDMDGCFAGRWYGARIYGCWVSVVFRYVGI